MKTLRNWVSVLTVTGFTAAALWAGVTMVDVVGGGAAYQTVATATGTQMVCPVSGCAAPTCHGATGAPAPASVGAPAVASAGAAGTSADGVAAAPGTSVATRIMTCPRTGCAATSCHGATGSRPPRPGSPDYIGRQ